jgi:hypothetical protein
LAKPKSLGMGEAGGAMKMDFSVFANAAGASRKSEDTARMTFMANETIYKLKEADETRQVRRLCFML